MFWLTVSFGQLITTPNKVIKRKKTGLWSSVELCDTIDFKGISHIVLHQHGNPESILYEGYYIDDFKEGFWNQYWIVIQIENNNTVYKKGPLKAIIEYKEGLLSGLFIENYRNGNMKVLGHFEVYQANMSDTVLQIPHWKYPNGNVMKDTLIHRKLDSRPFGKWYYFSTSGQLIK